LTLTGETPNASAMSRRDQPCRFKCNARNLRHTSPSGGSSSGFSIPPFYAARSVTFFAQRSVVKDLTDALSITVDPKCRIRLTEADLPTLRAALKVSGLTSTLGPGASNQLLRLVRQYDVYLLALSAWLVIPLPSWISTIDGGRGE